jgi:hypothetical protein
VLPPLYDVNDAMRLATLVAKPDPSSDLYRYIWDGDGERRDEGPATEPVPPPGSASAPAGVRIAEVPVRKRRRAGSISKVSGNWRMGPARGMRARRDLRSPRANVAQATDGTAQV